MELKSGVNYVENLERRIESLENELAQLKNQASGIRKDEAWLRQIYGEVPIMIFAIDSEAVLRHANEKWLAKTGYQREEVIGKKMKLFLPDKSKELIYGQIIPDFLRTGEVLNKEAQIIKKGGQLLDIRFSVVKTTDESGQFFGLTVVEDITEINRTRAALKESDEQYRKLIEGLPDVVVVTDLDGKIQKTSPNTHHLHIDFKGEKHEGSNLKDWILHAQQDEYVKSIENLLRGVPYVIGVYEFESVNDQNLFLEVRSTIIHDAYDHPKGVISILRDITREKGFQNQLMFSEQKLRQISESSADIIWMMNKYYDITYVSKASEKILGYTPDEVKQLDLESFQSTEELEKKKESLVGRFPGQRNPGQVFEPVTMEIQHIHKNGHTVWTEMVSSPLYDEKGKFTGLIGIIRDISERKANELAIHESQELYRSLIELSPEGIIILNNGSIVFANREFVKMLRVERENQILECDFLELAIKQDRLKLRDWLKRVGQHKATDQVQLVELRRFDGVPLYVEVMATSVSRKGMESALLFVRDVTQKILTDRELNKERELNETLISSIPDSIYYKNNEGQYIKLNHAAASVIGLNNPDDAIGKTDKDFFGNEHFQFALKEEQKIIKTRKPIIGDIRREIWPGGEEHWVSVTKMPLFGSDKEVIGTFGLTRDITRQKISEELLLKKEERFRHFFGQVNVGLAIINNSLEIQEVNNALCSILNYQEEELLHAKILSLVQKDNREEIKQFIENYQDNSSNYFQSECRLRVKVGEFIYVIFQIIPLKNVDEMKDNLLCQIVDINNRKNTEEQLVTRNTELNNFVYKVSHDLRAPLLSVKGLLNLMHIENDPEGCQEYLQMIDARVDKLDGFIRDILSHSKNLNTDIEIEEVDLESIIEHCFAQMKYHKNAGNIEKKILVSGKKIYSDAQRLNEIMRNLISNAVIYSSMERVNSFVEVKVKGGTNNYSIVVEDNGIGIKKAYVDKIFGMFYRANDKVEGSGIGLYIVYQSVDKLGGTIKVDSKLNTGTKFTIEIPNNLPR